MTRSPEQRRSSMTLLKDTMRRTACLITVVSALTGTIGAQPQRRSDPAASVDVIAIAHTDHGSEEVLDAVRGALGATATVSGSGADARTVTRFPLAGTPFSLTACRTNEACLATLARDRFTAALVVVSAVDGPMPGTREQIARALRTGIRRFVIVLTRTAKADDAELLQLVELEVRGLLDSLGFDGKSVPLVTDKERDWSAALVKTMERALAGR
jgi:hypothetical protein